MKYAPYWIGCTLINTAITTTIARTASSMAVVLVSLMWRFFSCASVPSVVCSMSSVNFRGLHQSCMRVFYLNGINFRMYKDSQSPVGICLRVLTVQMS